MNKLNKEDNDILNNLNDQLSSSDIIRFLMWNKIHNILYYISSKINSITAIVFISMQIIAIGVNINIQYMNPSPDIVLKTNYICKTINIMSLILLTLVEIVIRYTVSKSIESLDSFNLYTELLKESIEEEVSHEVSKRNDSI